ncbi:MAG TPA: alpha/beta fold hydrolase [Allosphingosinicella sp.]|nr:alpha/beta fold hydrolase [Allosphingosinicella sp.]
MSFHTMAYAALLAASAAPDAPACFTGREVAIASTAPGIRIAGELRVPRGEGRRPAIMMITGSGPHTRDQMISQTPSFRMLADFFSSLGFVVLRTDARGFGGSTGPDDEEQTTTAERVEDNRAALAFLRSRPEVDPQRIVLFGHSEGAMIAAELGAADPGLAALILLSTSAIPGEDVMTWQGTAGLRRRNDPALPAVQAQFRRFLRYLASGSEDRAEFRAIAADFLRAHGGAAATMDPAVGERALEGYLRSRWDRYFAGYDPRPVLARLRVPVIAIFAENDQNTPAETHMPALVEALAGGEHGDFSATLLPDQDHFYLEYQGRTLERHRPGEMAVADELYRLLAAELGRRLPLPTPCSPPTPAVPEPSTR